MELITLLTTTIPDWLEAILAVLVALNAIAALTPTPKDDKAIGKALGYVRKAIDFLAFNFGNSKNAK